MRLGFIGQTYTSELLNTRSKTVLGSSNSTYRSRVIKRRQPSLSTPSAKVWTEPVKNNVCQMLKSVFLPINPSETQI